MATYEVKIGDKTIHVEAGDNASDQEIMSAAQASAGRIGKGNAATMGVAAGGLANFDDELYGLLSSFIPGPNKEVSTVWSGDKSFGDTYRGNRDAYRREAGNQKRASPGSFTAGELVGGIGTGIVGGGAVAKGVAKGAPAVAAKAAGFASKRPRTAAILAGAGGGASGGAVSGAGAGTDAKSRLSGAKEGAAVGAAFGTAIGGAVGTLAPAIKKYVGAMRGGSFGPREAARQITKALEKDGFDITTRAGREKVLAELQKYPTTRGATIADLGENTRTRAAIGMRYPSQAQQPAIQQVTDRASGQAERLASDVRRTVAPQTGPNAGRIDVHKLNEQLVEEQATKGAADRKAAFYEQRAGTPAVPAELSRWMNAQNEGIPDLLAYVKDPTLGPVSRENVNFLMTQSGRPQTPTVDIFAPNGTLMRDPANAMGTRGVLSALRDYRRDFPEVDAINGFRVTGARAGMRSELSGTGRRVNDPRDVDLDMTKIRPSAPLKPGQPAVPGGEFPRMVSDRRIEALLSDPQSPGFKAVREAMELERGDRIRRGVMGEDTGKMPPLNVEGPYTYEMIDGVKQYLDSAVNSLAKGDAGNTFKQAEMHNLKRLRNDLRNLMRESNPEYDNYLKGYGERGQMIDALEEGGGYGRLSPDQIAAEQAERSQGGRELYRTGAARKGIDNLLSTQDGRPATGRVASSPQEVERLRALGLNETELAELTGGRQQEIVLNKLYEQIRGPQSTRISRQSAEEEASGIPTMQLPYNIGNPVGWAGAAGRGARDKLMLRAGAQVNENLLPMMMQNTSEGITKTIQQLAEAGRFEEARKVARALIAGRGGYATGVASGDVTNEEGY